MGFVGQARGLCQDDAFRLLYSCRHCDLGPGCLQFSRCVQEGDGIQRFLQAEAAFCRTRERQHTAHGPNDRVRFMCVSCVFHVCFMRKSPSGCTCLASTLPPSTHHRYHCYSFEGFHQKVKRISKASNYKNVSKRIMKFHCIQFGLIHKLRNAHARRKLSNLC